MASVSERFLQDLASGPIGKRYEAATRGDDHGELEQASEAVRKEIRTFVKEGVKRISGMDASRPIAPLVGYIAPSGKKMQVYNFILAAKRHTKKIFPGIDDKSL